MDVLNHLAQAAAVILLVELLVFLLIFAAAAGGLSFGLRWVRGKTSWAFDLVNTYVALAAKYVHTGTDYVAKPVIVASAFGDTVRTTASSVRNRVRALRYPASRSGSRSTFREAVVSVPTDVIVTQPIGAVVTSEDDTTIVPAVPETVSTPPSIS